MTCKIIFSDIDGTFLTPEQTVSDKTKACLARHADIPFILVSGRMPTSIRTIQRESGLRAPLIAYSGALAWDENGAVLYDKAMTLATAVSLREKIRSGFPEIVSYTFSNDDWITDVDDGTAALYLEKETTAKRPLVGQPEQVLKPSDPVHKILCAGEPDLIDALENSLKPEFPQCTIFKSQARYLEIMARAASKSAAAAALCDLYGIGRGDVVAFGDNFNDVDLLQFAGTGVAMGNAPDAVKAAADLVAPSNAEDGLAVVLDSLLQGK